MKTTSQNGAEFIAGTEAAKDTSQPVLTDESAYLRLLGESVRSARARRGMTRKMLATHSGVSERFLAQLESGSGNASILILRQIAQAAVSGMDGVRAVNDCIEVVPASARERQREACSRY